MSQQDPQGIQFPTANSRGMEHYARLIQQMSWFQASVFDTISAAIEENPEFGMPYFAQAYLNLYMTEPRFRQEAISTMDRLRASVRITKLSEIEQAHVRAIDAWIGGDLRKACSILDHIGLEHPREILALRVGHEADFFVGATRNLRDRIARQLPAWSDRDLHYGIVLGAYAFGLEENGHYDLAEVYGRKALGLNKDDAWALHAVAHSFEMRGMTGEGVRFMIDRTPDWAENNLFSAHNWWHTALFHLDSGDAQAALSIYDQGIFNDSSMKVALVLLDAASMLWRMHLQGTDVKERARALSSAWSETLPETPYYVFNDMHAAMAHVAAADQSAAERVLRRIDDYLQLGDDGSNNYRNAERVGRPVVSAIVAYGAGRFEECAQTLYTVRGHASEFGGSAAQRDVLDRTILAAAMRGGLKPYARAIASEKIALVPDNASHWSRYAAMLRVQDGPVRQLEHAEAEHRRLSSRAGLFARRAAIN